MCQNSNYSRTWHETHTRVHKSSNFVANPGAWHTVIMRERRCYSCTNVWLIATCVTRAAPGGWPLYHEDNKKTTNNAASKLHTHTHTWSCCCVWPDLWWLGRSRHARRTQVIAPIDIDNVASAPSSSSQKPQTTTTTPHSMIICHLDPAVVLLACLPE